MYMYPGAWRDQQINGFLNLDNKEVVLEQEQLMLDFVRQFPEVRWLWQSPKSPKSQFYNLCARQIQITSDYYNGIILFGLPNMDSASLVRCITKAISDVDYAYVAINRYKIDSHNLDFDLPDSIDESIDLIMQHCDHRFRRLKTFSEVDGNHMVFAHPMDCYGLCK